MICVESRLRASDNSGGLIFKCIKIFKGYKKKYARLGDIVGSISKTRKAYSKEFNKQKSLK